MDKPHIYSSGEIYNAVNVGWGVDDHLRNCQFVKLKDYDEKVAELINAEKFNFGMFFDERELGRYLRQRVDQLEREKASLETQLVKAVQEQEKWIPCSVQLPERGEYVLVLGRRSVEVRCWDMVDDTDDYSGEPIQYRAWFKEDEISGDPYFEIEFDDILYWMPKPKDPSNTTREDTHE